MVYVYILPGLISGDIQ